MQGKDPVGADRGLWSGRERFQAEGTLPTPVRPEIARSWLRSRESGVQADGDPRTGHGDFDPEARLLRLSQPILDRLSEEVDNADMTVILTDSRGLVLDRRAGSASLLRGLDKVMLTPGHFYSEETVGTNGIGTAAEDRSAAWVVGSEHYADWLRWLSCAGAPIRNPITGRIEGILDLTCRLRDTSPLMVAFVKEGVREIERRLYEEASERDRELLERFVAVARRSTRPVVALNSQTVITNAAATRLLEPSDHALLWSRIADALLGGTDVVHGFRLSHGTVAGIRCVPGRLEHPSRGVVVEIDLEQAESGGVRPSRRSEPRPRAVPPGRSVAWQHVLRTVAEAGASRLPVLVTGEPGTGKLTVARAIHDAAAAPGELTVLDAELARVDGAKHWLARVRTVLAADAGSVVLRHLEALDEPVARGLGALLAEARGEEEGPRVIATASTAGADPDRRAPPGEWPSVVHVPPLRQRPEDIVDIVEALLRRHAGAQRPRCSPEATRALSRADWPGNVRELESVIEGVLARRPMGEIRLRDLPAEYHAVRWRRLTRMERAERETILEALTQTGGNKVRAASLLGVGRATLYRKLKQLGISDPQTPA